MRVEPFDQLLVGDALRRSIYVALGAVVLVLLIACANITNLLLAQGARPAQELAVRAALGASRGRIAAQLLVECLVLGGLGGTAGVGLAALLIRIAVPLLPPMPFTAEVALDWRVLGFAVATAVAVSVLVGLLPAIRGVRHGSRRAQHAARGSSGAHDRVRRTIVAAEVAVSVVLICGAFLLFKSLVRLQQVDIGARIDHVITMSLDLPWDRYPTGMPRGVLSAARRAAAGDSRASSRRRCPATCRSKAPAARTSRMPGREERLLIRFKRADAAYFPTLGIPVVAGRGFTADDRVGAPYVAVDQRGAGPPAPRPVRRHRPGRVRRWTFRRWDSVAIGGPP